MDLNVLSNLVITKVFSATNMYTEKNTKFKRNNRSSWAFIIKYEGETMYVSKGKSYLSDINNLVILPKGCSYEWCCTRSGHYFVVEFDSKMEYDAIFNIHVRDSEKILNLFKKMEYTRALKKPMYEIESIRDAYSILLMLMQSMQKKYLPSKKYAKISPAVNYIIQNYNQHITNDKLAELTGLSVVYFRKLFYEVFGTSPISYVHDLRIKKAKEMLKSDYGSITDIAESLGYNSIYEFSKAFKNKTGISPSKY